MSSEKVEFGGEMIPHSGRSHFNQTRPVYFPSLFIILMVQFSPELKVDRKIDHLVDTCITGGGGLMKPIII